MIVDISLVTVETSKRVVFTNSDGQKIKNLPVPVYPSPDWVWDENSNLRLTIQGETYRIRFSTLTINGETPADIDDADDKLTVVFPNAGGATGSTNLEAVTTDIVITDAAKGVVLKSPNGNQHRLSINNDGSITTTQI